MTELTKSLIYYGCFFTALLYMAILAGFQYTAARDRAFRWYVLYILCNAAFYFRSISILELPEVGYGFAGNVPLYWEGVLGFSIYIFYFLFVGSFLNLHENSPYHHKILIISVKTFAVFILLNLLLQWTTGVEWAKLQYLWANMLLLPLALVFIWSLLYKVKAPQSGYILAGSLVLAAASVFTVLRKLNVVEGQYLMGGTFIMIKSGIGNFPVLSVKTSILCEMVCFSLALTMRYKSLMENFKPGSQPATLPAGINGHRPELLSVPGVNNNVRSNGEHPFLKKVKTIVEENLANEDFTVAELCGNLHLSSSQVRKKIKALTGTSTDLYIRSIRLSHAKDLLTQTDHTIAEVALKCGFKDPAYFSNVFRQEVGVAPSEWRSNNAISRS